MTIAEMHIALKLELDKSDSLNNLSFEPEELDYWINKAIKRFVKTRYSGSNYKSESFEETQKRTDDLRTLVVVNSFDLTKNYTLPLNYDPFMNNSYYVELPENYYFALSEDCKIVFNAWEGNYDNKVLSGNLEVGQYDDSFYMVMIGDITHDGNVYSPGDVFAAQNTVYTYDEPEEDEEHPYVILLDQKIQAITQVNSDVLREHIDNPYSEHRLHYGSAKPLRVFRNDGNTPVVVLISDGTYFIVRYFLTYLRAPATVSSTPTIISCDLPVHTHDEIIDLAALMLIENIESNRLQSKAAMSINE